VIAGSDKATPLPSIGTVTMVEVGGDSNGGEGHDASRTFIIVATYANETVRENWRTLVILEPED
jgi:hypothetical protein